MMAASSYEGIKAKSFAIKFLHLFILRFLNIAYCNMKKIEEFREKTTDRNINCRFEKNRAQELKL